MSDQNSEREIIVPDLHERAIEEAINMLSAVMRSETRSYGGHGSREVLKERLKNADRPTLRDRLLAGS